MGKTEELSSGSGRYLSCLTLSASVAGSLDIIVHSQLEIISKNVCASPEHASGQLQIPVPGITVQHNTSHSWQATLCSSGPQWPILQLGNNKAISCPLARTGSPSRFLGEKESAHCSLMVCWKAVQTL